MKKGLGAPLNPAIAARAIIKELWPARKIDEEEIKKWIDYCNGKVLTDSTPQ